MHIMSLNAEKKSINDILRNSIFTIPRNQNSSLLYRRAFFLIIIVILRCFQDIPSAYLH